MATPPFILAETISETLDVMTIKPAIQTSIVLGIRFHRLRIVETVEILRGFISERTPHQICMANAHTVALSQKDPALRDLLNKADLVLADGMSIVWGGRWVGAQLPERVAGPDLMGALCKESAQHGYRIFLLGSTPENLTALSKALQRDNGMIQFAGTYSPPFCEQIDESENERIMALLRESRADILFVGMSAPKQEKWIAENLHRLPVSIAIGVGAAFDFLSGRIPRAPSLMQKIGLEWLYRLYCDPRRLWRRYLYSNAIFLSCLLKQKLLEKFSARSSA